MIHHLARAFHVREVAIANQAAEQNHNGSATNPSTRPVKPRPLTPWSVPQRHNQAVLADLLPRPRVRISSDPTDVRRTVMSGKFAEVCAALERLVHEQEAAA